ncbi:MAG: RagB/SusD family nutrient uptake outer membrane protein [Bacteroidetes bacterium]|nr:MAG: RagB/SusD family nutrient uptake outer membrane protein [Bacteroidota bacterium]
MNTYKFFAYFFLLLAFTACKEDFLDLKPNEALPTEDAIKSISDLNAAAVGMYDGLQSSNYYGRYFILVPDVMSDDVKQNASANRAKEYAEYGAFADHFITQNMWAMIYSVINRANTIINTDLTVAPAVEAQKNQILGEAYAVRALAHFDLVRLYGQHYGITPGNTHPGVPIVTVFDQNSEPARNTVKEVYDQVLSDLNTALGLMGDDFDSGRFSKLAVQALLARVYLYMGNWSEAEKFATNVINAGVVSLTSTDNYVSTWMDGTSPDAIFQIVMTDVDNNGSDALGRMYIQAGYGDYLPSLDVVDLIPAGDVRRQLFTEDENLGGVFGLLRVNKWPSQIGADNTPVIRLSEIYLIRAEARAMTGNEAGAQADVTLIRQRGLPTAEAVTATGQALLDEIEKEKRIELMFEGHRLWELMRKQRGVVRTDCTAPAGKCVINYPNDRFVLPIPQNEIDANPNMTQNPGY